jgi:uncharacterized protein YcfL
LTLNLIFKSFKMKKVFLAAFVAGLTLASCSSEKDCECSTSINGVVQTTSTQTIEDGECEDLNSTSGPAAVTCEEV